MERRLLFCRMCCWSEVDFHFFLSLLSWCFLYRNRLILISSPYLLSWTALFRLCAVTGGDTALSNEPTFSWEKQLAHWWFKLRSVCNCMWKCSFSLGFYLSLSALFSSSPKTGLWLSLGVLISSIIEQLCLEVTCDAVSVREGRGQLRTGCRGMQINT